MGSISIRLQFLSLSVILKTLAKQDCIPVGYVPPACWLYLPACTAHRGLLQGAGVCLLLGEGGVCSGGFCSWGVGGGCSKGEGVCSLGISQHALSQTSPHCGQNDRHV